MPIASHGLGVLTALTIFGIAAVFLSEPTTDPLFRSGAVILYILVALSAIAAFASSISFGIASAGMRRFSTNRLALLLGLAVGLIGGTSHVAWYLAGADTMSGGLSLLLFAALSAAAPLATKKIAAATTHASSARR